jgi:phosphoribosylamine-glycine ligase
VSLRWKPEAALTVVMAARGYPGPYKKGTPIRGLERVKTAKARAKGGGVASVGAARGSVWAGRGPPLPPRRAGGARARTKAPSARRSGPARRPPTRAARPSPSPAKVFHAGTATDAAGGLVASGGRVLGVTALGRDVSEAQSRAYEGVDAVDWPEGFCRRDIGWRAVARLAGAAK